MYRSLSPKQLSPYFGYEQDRRDLLIKELTKEINGLESLDYNFLALNDDMAEIESRYAMILEEKEREEKEFRQSTEAKRRQMEDAQKESDGLAVRLESILVETEEASRVKQRLIDRLHSLKSQVQRHEREIAQVTVQNQSSTKQIGSLNSSLKETKDERKELEDACDSYSAELTFLTDEVKKAQKEYRRIEASIVANHNILSEQTRIKLKNDQQLKHLRSEFAKAQADLRNMIILREEQTRIRAGLIHTKQETAKVLASTKRQLDLTSQSNRDALEKLKSCESHTLKVSLEVEETHHALSQIRASNATMFNRNRQLNFELEQMMKDMREKERRLSDLRRTLKDSLECDSKVTGILAHRQSVLTGLLKDTENIRPLSVIQ